MMSFHADFGSGFQFHSDVDIGVFSISDLEDDQFGIKVGSPSLANPDYVILQ